MSWLKGADRLPRRSCIDSTLQGRVNDLGEHLETTRYHGNLDRQPAVATLDDALPARKVCLRMTSSPILPEDLPANFDGSTPVTMSIKLSGLTAMP